MSNQARAKLFEIELDGYSTTTPEFQAMFKAITNDETAHKFVKFYGTHWIEKAKFGAQYDKQISIGVDSDVSSASKFKESVKNGGVEIWGFGHS